jgi:hypothetical protein
MNIKQLPWLGSALCMTAGLYLLAGPFQADRSDLTPLFPLWVVLTLYEIAVIGMIAVLRRRGVDTFALQVVSLFFLADPIFLGDAFASVGSAYLPVITIGAGLLGIAKAWGLARACDYSLTPWRAGWVSAALFCLHQIPDLNAAAGTQPAIMISQLTTWGLAALSVPLWRVGRLGRFAVGALGVHFMASQIVASLDFQLEHATAPLLAMSALMPWPRLGWIPLPAALYTSPFRLWVKDHASTSQGLGTALVAGAFLLLGIGFWSSLRSAPPEHSRPASPGTFL